MKHPTSRSCTGFTLVEMMCAVAIAGVVSSLAVPGYQSAMQKTRRCEAQVALLQAQMVQERFRADHAIYGSSLTEIGLPATTPSGYYALSVTDHSKSGYEIQAAAMAVQSADIQCRHLRMTVDGYNIAYASGADTSFSNPIAVNKKCWAQ